MVQGLAGTVSSNSSNIVLRPKSSTVLQRQIPANAVLRSLAVSAGPFFRFMMLLNRLAHVLQDQTVTQTVGEKPKPNRRGARPNLRPNHHLGRVARRLHAGEVELFFDDTEIEVKGR
jgi:hypothetical protein